MSFDPFFSATGAEGQKIAKAVKGWFRWEHNLPHNVAQRKKCDRDHAAELRKRIKSLAPTD